MGNSIGRDLAPGCFMVAENYGRPSTWEAGRSMFSPFTMALDSSVGGASGPTFSGSHQPSRSTADIMAEIKQGEPWKQFMEFMDVSKPYLEAGQGELDEDHEFEDFMAGTKDYYPTPGDPEFSRDPVKEAFKTNLHKLKDKTGFSYSFCKKALEESNNDLEKAEEWMEQESKKLGLVKLEKIDNRRSAEGLVGIAWEDHHAAIVEVNSESDFVSSNVKFHELVDIVAKTCLQHTKENNPSPKTLSKVKLKGDEMGSLVAADKKSLSDHVIKAIALMGERLRLRRAALVSTQESSRIAVHTHSSSSSAETSEYKDQGRLGTVLVYNAKEYNDSTTQLAKYLCQQIIGMNPKTIELSEGGDKETALLTQKYLREPNLTVAEVVERAGLKVEHFVRFERGEPGEDPGDLGTEPAKPLC